MKVSTVVGVVVGSVRGETFLGHPHGTLRPWRDSEGHMSARLQGRRCARTISPLSPLDGVREGGLTGGHQEVEVCGVCALLHLHPVEGPMKAALKASLS